MVFEKINSLSLTVSSCIISIAYMRFIVPSRGPNLAENNVFALVDLVNR